MAKTSKPKVNALPMPAKANGEVDLAYMAQKMIGPGIRHGLVGQSFANACLAAGETRPGLLDCADYVSDVASKAAKGDIAFVSELLAAQALALDTMFTELARRSALNMGEYINAAERYGRLALKAQANSRATLEALAKLHQPREQTVRHVHVNQGGQAIVAEQFHHHTGGGQNAKPAEQSHATGGAGTSPALPCQDALGDIVQSPGGIRPAAMSDARRD